MNPCRVKRHLPIGFTLQRSQSYNRVINPSIPYVRSTYVMFGHTPPQSESAVVRSVSTPRSPGLTAPGPQSTGGPLLLAPRVVRVDAPRAAARPPPSHRLEQRGRSYLRRPVESELALRHALCPRLDVGPEPPYLPFQHSRMPRLNTVEEC